jgi:hypothetical protein
MPTAPAITPVMVPYRSSAATAARREPVAVGPEPTAGAAAPPGNAAPAEAVAPVQPGASAAPLPPSPAPPAGAVGAKPKGSVDLAEIDRYLEGLGKL